MLWKATALVLKKLNTELLYELASPLQEAYPKEPKTIQTDICKPMFTKALLTIAKWWKEPRCPPTDERINRGGIYIQWNIIRP